MTSTTSRSQLHLAQAATTSAEAAQKAADRDVDAAQAKVRAAQRAIWLSSPPSRLANRRISSGSKPLIAKDEISKQQFDAAVEAQEAAQAAVESAKASVSEAQANVAVSEARRAQAASAVAQAQAQTQAAETAPQQVAMTRSSRADGRCAGPASQGRPRRGQARPRAHDDRRAGRRHRRAARASKSVRSCRSASRCWRLPGSRTSGSWPTSRRPSSSRCGPASRPQSRSIPTGQRLHRPGREHRRRHGCDVQPAAAGQRERKFREGRTAGAGQDRARGGPGHGGHAAARHVGRPSRCISNDGWRGAAPAAPDPKPGAPSAAIMSRSPSISLADRHRGDVRHVHGRARHDRGERVAVAHRRQSVGDRRRVDVGVDVRTSPPTPSCCR